MARAYKNKSIVSGMSINDILNIDNEVFNRLTESDMRKVVGRLVSAGNKRLRSFERAEEKSPATRHINRSGGVFSTKGKTLNELRAEYVRAKNFLTAKTGTRRGWKQVKKATIKSLNKRGIMLAEFQFDLLWDAYEDLKELSPDVANKNLKYRVLTDISDMMVDDSKTAEEIATELHNQLSEIYEEQAEIDNEFDGVSGYFEF